MLNMLTVCTKSPFSVLEFTHSNKLYKACLVILSLLFLTTNAFGQTLISITNPPRTVTASAAGHTQFWPTAGTVNGVPISLRATLTSISAGDRISLFTSGDNPVVRANTGTLSSTVRWEVFNAATGAPIVADPNFLITDIDGNNGNPIESVSAACAGLTSYTVNGNYLAGCNANSSSMCETNIRVSESGGNILAEGTQGQNGNQQEGYMQYSWNGVTSWVVNYFATSGGRWYVHDADGDVPFDGTQIDVNLVDMATIKGVSASSLTSPAQGELITFQIDLSNAGPEDATGVNLTDLLPSGVSYVSHTVSSGNYNPSNGQWSGASVAVNVVETLTVTAIVTAPAGTTVTNVTTTALAAESVCSSRDLLEYTFIVAEIPDPSLTVAKSVSAATSFSQAGDTVTYSYLVTNTGNVNIDNVVPTDGGPTFNGAAATNSLNGFAPASATITPGNSQTYTATYLLDQIDVDNMAQDANPLLGINNTASATGNPSGGVLPVVPDSTAETGFAPTPSLSIVKQVSGATAFDGVGDTITYQYTVTNGGNITIDDVAPTDIGPTFNGVAAASALSAFSPATASIAPGSNQVFTATYLLQQADVDNMAAAADPLTAIDNSAGATGDPVGTTALPAVTESIAETGFAPSPSMTIAKSVSSATTFSQAGDTITYEYELDNTGNVTINNAVPTDSGPTFNGLAGTNALSAFSPASATIAPNGPPVTFTATYVLSQQDIDNMFLSATPATAIDNTASASGTPTGGTLPTVPDSTAETGFVLDAALTLAKSAGTPSIGLGINPAATDAGDTITYSFDVTNSGDVTIDALVINDTGPTFNGIVGTGSWSMINCSLTSLAPTQMTSCTATYTLSQADVDNAIVGGANAVENTATASGEDPSNAVVASPDDMATQTIASDSSVEIAKSAGAPTVVNGADPALVDPGDTISYQLDIDNTGNTTLSNVLISDSIATVSCPATTNLGAAFTNDGTAQMAVGDGIVCTAIYTLLQTDLDNGGVQNTADVASTDPTGAAITDSDMVDSGFTQKTSISLLKSATPLPSPASVGDPITYSFELSNTGNVTLTSAQIVDPICETPASPLTFISGYVSGDTGAVGEMEAGETWIFECEYTIDLDDINLGEVANTATGSGQPPASSGLPAPENTASNLADADQNAAIALDKSSSLPTVAAGALTGATDVGDTVAYSFAVENTGNVTLTNVMVTDPLITAAPNNGTINCPAGISSMVPGAIAICTATYNVTQIDIDAGMIVNTGNATGTPPTSVPPVDVPEAASSNMVTIAPTPGLTITKSVAALTATLNVGDTINYSFLVENSGNVTINGVLPVDSGPTFNGAAGVNPLSAFSPASADLEPGTSETFTATYTLTQADIDNIAAAADPLTAIDNSATADGTPVNGSLPPVDPSTTETGAAPNPSVDLQKSSMAPVLVEEGENITYTFLLNNNGNVTVSNPVINDAVCSMPGTVLSFASGYVSGDTGDTPESLDVGETWTFECTYAITQADINAGTVANTATGGGQDPSGASVEDDAQQDTALAQSSLFSVVKSTVSVPSLAGDTLVYQFLVDNLGNVDITALNVMDTKCAAVPMLISGDVGADLVLSPPEMWTFQCTSIPVTQAEVDAGMVDNEVDVVGTAPPGAPTPPVAEDNISIPIAPMPSLTVDKTAGVATTGLGMISDATDAGDTISYTFDVVNDGNVTVSALTINDSGPTFDGVAGVGAWSAVTCPTTTLLPLQSTTCTATYTLTQQDIDRAIAGGADSVENSATAQGQDPDGMATTSTPDTDTTSIGADSEIQVLKTASAPTVADGSDPALTDPGDTIDFTITVENTGNSTLSDVLVTDNLIVFPNTLMCDLTASPSGSPFTNDGTASLAVGDRVECTATYIIEQSDINAGQVINTASVAAQDPASGAIGGVVEAVSPFTQKTSVALLKTASVLSAVPFAGELITYTFDLENTGNVSLSDAQVDDAQCEIPVGPLTASNGLIAATDTGADGILDAGETWTFECQYVLKTTDIVAGEVTNTATGTGTPPVSSGLDAPTATSSALVIAEQNAAITLDKVAGLPTVSAGVNPLLSDVGDTITFSFNIRNAGNLPFDTVSLDDPLITDAPNSGVFTCVRNNGMMTPFTLGADQLASLDDITCTGVYTLTQADVDAGDVANTATVIGNPPITIPPAPPPEAVSGSTAPVPPAPSMTIAKSASTIPASVVAGDVITYTYLVVNAGNVTIANVAPIDLGPTFNGVAGTNALSAYTPMIATIAPNSDQSFEATYIISQQDLDNMAAAAAPATAIANEATADGEPANGSIPPVPPSTVETGVAPSPELELIKTSSVTTPVAAGSVVTYTFMLSNIGNVTISNPVVTDSQCQSPASPLSFSSGYISGDTGAIALSLDVGETWEFACSYLVTQTNMDAGTVQNTANGSGQDPAGGSVDDVSDSGNIGDGGAGGSDPTNTPLTRTPDWMIEKSTTSLPTAVGQTLDYTFVLRNTGNTSINSISVTDAKCVGGVATLDTATDLGSDTVLSPAGAGGVPAAEQWTYNCTSIPVTQAEMDSGIVINEVTAMGIAPGGGLLDATDRVETNVTQTPSMSLVKSAGINTLNFDGTFDQIFNFELKNVGNITLDTVTLTDNITAQFGSCFITVVDPGTVAFNDVIPVLDSDTLATGTTPIVASANRLGVGDSIVVTDYIVRFDPNARACVFPDPAQNTASGESVQANDVSDNGTDPDLGNPDDAGTPTPFFPPTAMPQLTLTKAGTVNQNGSIDYAFTVLNSGDVNVSDIVVSDVLITSFIYAAGDDADSDDDIDLLTPGESAVVTANYILSDDDLLAGSVDNTASTNGQDPSSMAVVDDSDSANLADDTGADNDPTTTLVGQPEIAVAKRVADGSPVDLGNGSFQMTYEFVIENIGDFDLSNIQLEDDLVAMINDPNPNNASFSNPVVTSPDSTLTPSTTFNGSSNIALLSGDDSLVVGATGLIELSFVFTPDVYFGPFNNQATTSAQLLNGSVIEDLSENGADTNSDTESMTPFSLTTPSTPITLGWFRASEQGSDVLFEWATEVEVSNAGFYISVLTSEGDWRRVNDDLIASQGDSVSVQSYQFLGAGLLDGLNETKFLFADVSVTGAIVQHGPFELNQEYGMQSFRKATDWQEIKQESDDKKQQRDEQRRNELRERMQQLNNQGDSAQIFIPNKKVKPIATKRTGVFERLAGVILSALVGPVHATELVSFEVEEAGLYRVTHAQLNAQGLDLSGVSLNRIGIKENGQLWPIKFYPEGASNFSAGSSIIFPGRGIDTLYSITNQYTLVLDEGQLAIVDDPTSVPENTAPAFSYLAEQSYAPQNHYTHISPSEQDSWYADSLKAITSPASKQISLTVTDYAPALNVSNANGFLRSPVERPRLEVNLWGNSNLPGNGVSDPDHHVLVELNGQPVADETFDGLRVHNIETVLTDISYGENLVTVSLPKDHGYQFDLVNLNAVTLRYPRRFYAQDAGRSLVFDSVWNFFRIRMLTDNNVTVIRVDEDGSGHEMTNIDSCDTDCVFFGGSDSSQVGTYYVATDAGLKTPNINLLATEQDILTQEAVYLIIAHPDFIQTPSLALEAYAGELASIYGSADIVNVENIYAQYSGHVFDAEAIHDYIIDAVQQRATKHVVLVGGDMYDYLGNLDNDAKSFIPSLYVKIATNVNAVPSDAQYADIDADFIPDITITRLPVRSSDELTTLLAKRQNYLARDYQNTAIFSADEVDGSGYSFKSDAVNAVATHFTDWAVQGIYLDDVSVSQGKQQLVSAINAGASLTSYIGHSSTDRWSLSGLLTGSDVATLNNTVKPTVVTQWGCWNTFYVSPEQDSLAHRFLVDGNNGAVTVMGASSFTKAAAEVRMADLLFARINQGMRIGDAVLSAKRALAQDYPYQLDVLLGWAVLGPDDMTIIEN